jgi:hypothetical protein
VFSRAAHLPLWQRQPPPQSVVSGMQTWVQSMLQVGACSWATQALGWQHEACTQSASDWHESEPTTISPGPG